jgi:hypothetical protein
VRSQPERLDVAVEYGMGWSELSIALPVPPDETACEEG